MSRTSKKAPLIAAIVALAAACGSPATATPTSTSQVEATPAAQNEEVVLASGQFALPAAGEFGQRGFHEILETRAQLPSDLGILAGSRLVLRLRDRSRPAITCDSPHPLSGCATVDWSDFPGRPGVPGGGAFENRITISLADGASTFYLSESGQLMETPEPYSLG